jgi:hypothetical protein
VDEITKPCFQSLLLTGGMHLKQTSITSQVVPQPLISFSMSRQEICNNLAAAARSSNSLRRRNSLPKRDSAISLGQAGSRSDAQRSSVRRSFQSSDEESAFIEDDLAEFFAEKPTNNMGPVYRLVR